MIRMKHQNLLKFTVLLITGLFANEIFGQSYITATSCDFTAKITKHGTYGDNWTYDSNWNIFGGNNYNGNWEYIKLGANKTSLITPVYINNISAINQDIAVVTVTTNAGNLEKGSLISWALCVFSDSARTNRIDSVVGETMTKGTAETFTFKPTEGTSWGTKRFFKLTFDVNNTTTANGIIWIDKIEFKTTSTDETAPTFTEDYPKVANISYESLDLIVNADETCTVYYMVLTKGSDEPTSTDIVNNNKTIAVTTANTDFTGTINELTPETDYEIYLVAKDASGNTSNISKVEAKTDISTEKSITVKPLFKDKYCWGDTANIYWTTTNIVEATEQDSIIIYKNGNQIYRYSIDITKKQANIVVGDGSQGNLNIYGTDYSLAIKSGETTSSSTENFTVFPFANIKDILQNSNYKDKFVRVKGLVTGTKGTTSSGVKYLNLTLQDNSADSSAIFANYCTNDTIEIGDSIFIEGKVSNSSTGLTNLGASKTNFTEATIINKGNKQPDATESTIADALEKDGKTCTVINLTNVTYTSKGFTDGTDTIACENKLYSGTMGLIEGRKYYITGIKGFNKVGQIWPRSSDDIYLYSNDTTLATFNINGKNALNADSLYFSSFNDCKGIEIATNDSKTTFSVRVNTTNVDASTLEDYVLAENDSIIVCTTAEDGSIGTFKVVIAYDPNYQEINLKPLFKDKYYWGDTANIYWSTFRVQNATNKDSIVIFKGNVQVYSYPIDVTANHANIVIGDGSENCKKDEYGTDYSLVVKNDKTISKSSDLFTLIPKTSIKNILTNPNEFKNTVRVKGLVTGTKGTTSSGIKYLNLTLQDNSADSSAIFANYCTNDTIEIGDSIFIEGKVSNSSTGLTNLGASKTNFTEATIINKGNKQPDATESTIADALEKDGKTCTVINLTNVTYTSKGFTDGTDTIACENKLYSGTMGLIEGRKYYITGIKGFNKVGQIWPRSSDDIYLYSNDTTLATFNINGKNALNADSLYFSSFNDCKGIEIATNDSKTTFSVRVNTTNVDASTLEDYVLTENDSIIVCTTAEDGSTGTFKVVIAKDKTNLKFNTLATNEFGTGDTINLTWTQFNISDINILLSFENHSILLNSNPLQANSEKFQFVVPNSMFGQGLFKAIRVNDNTTLDSLSVTINDTEAPKAKLLSPANGATQVAVNTYLTLTFDDTVKISENAIINIGDLKADLIAVDDTSAKAFVNELKFGEEYKLTIPSGAITDEAGNDAVIGEWSFTTKTAPTEDLYFSEYCEGAVGNNKYYEIYNPKATAVDLSSYIVMTGTNGGVWKSKLQLQGTLSSESVFIAMNSKADTLTNLANILTTNTLAFNGDDALGLFKISGNDTILIDVIGNYGEDPGTAWYVAGIKDATKDHVLVRKEIVGGTTDWAESAGTDSLDSQWIVLEDADYSNIGKHGIGHRTEILSFALTEIKADATINSDSANITIEALYGTDLTKLTPVFTLSRGAQLLIDNKQVSSTTMNFSKPVKATVVAEDGINMKDWTITVTTTAKLSNEAEILFFKFVEASAKSTDIMSDEALIDILMPYGTDITKLTPWFLISPNASVSSTTLRLANYQVSSTVTMNFSKPQTFDIYAQDLTKKTWTVNVETEQPLALTIHNIQFTKNDTSIYVNKLVTTEGVISSIYTDEKGTEFYIQDSVGEWSGILVYDERSKFASKAKMGDKVSVTGVVTEYFTITEITDLKDFKTISEGNTVESMALTAEDAKTEEFESVLVTIKGLTCTDGSGNTFTAEDETDNLSVYNKYKFSGFTMGKDSIYNVTGIMYYYSSSNTYEIIPRSLADIVNVTPVEPDDTIPIAVNEMISSINIYAFNNTIVVENADADIYVFDIAGKAVAIRKNTSNRVEIKMSDSGLYIIRVGKEAQKVVIR
mgnify:CR=1 FL=1